jgi:hypothetical protein
MRYSFRSAPANYGRERIPRLHFLPLAFQQVVSRIIGKAAHYRDGSDGAVISLPGSFGVLPATVVEGEGALSTICFVRTFRPYWKVY